VTRVILAVVGLFLAVVLTLVLFGVDPIQGLKLIGDGAFGDKFGVARTLVRSTPLLLCGLGIMISWRAGMYNVGGEGQYIVGGIGGAMIAKMLLASNPTLANIAVLGGSIVGGSLFAAFAGWLQVKRGVQCVISTILLNFIAIQGLAWAVRGPLQESKRQLPLTDRLPNAMRLQRFDPMTDLHSGVFIALIALVAVAIFLNLSKSGFKLKLVGENPRVARANQINPDRVQISAMAISGALCGLAGGVDYLGLTGQIGDGFSQNWGFLAIPVALLGGLNPWGVLCSALFFGALMAGGEGLARFNSTGTTLVYVIQAVAVLGFVGFTQFKRRKEVVID